MFVADVDLYLAVHHGGYVAGGAVDAVLLAQAAAEDVADHRTAEDVDGGGLDGVHVVAVEVGAVGVDVAEGRAAVDVAVEGGFGGAGGVAEGHMDVAVHIGGLAEAAAEDAGVFGYSAYGAAEDVDGGVAGHGAGGVAATIDTGIDSAFVHDDLGVTADAGLVAAAVKVGSLAVEAVHRHDGAAGDGSGIAAAEDATLNQGYILRVTVDGGIRIFHGGKGIHGRGVVAYIDTGVGRDDSRSTLAATVDVATYGVILTHMHHIDGGRGGTGISGGIGRQVAGAVDVMDAEVAGPFMVKHVDSDVARDVAVDVRTAEGILVDGAAVEVEGDVAVNVGSDGIGTLRATVDILHGAALEVEDHVAGDVGSIGAAVDVGEGAGAALDGRGDVGGDIHLVRAAEEVGDLLGASAHVVDIDVDGAADGALGVTAADEGAYGAAVDGEVDTAGADIGCRHLAVTAAEDVVEAATLKVDRGAGDSSGIAAAEDAADGVVAAEDIDCGHLAGNGVVGVLTAAEDIGDGIAGIGKRVHAGGVGRAVDVHRHLLLR